MAVLRDLAVGLMDASQRHPDAEVIRNDVGNVVFLDPQGEPLGWVDVLTGQWEYF